MKGARKMKGNGNRCRGSLASPVSGKLLRWLYGRTRRNLKKSYKSFSNKEGSDWSFWELHWKSWRRYENIHTIWVYLLATYKWAQNSTGKCYKLFTNCSSLLCGQRREDCSPSWNHIFFFSKGLDLSLTIKILCNAKKLTSNTYLIKLCRVF